MRRYAFRAMEAVFLISLEGKVLSLIDLSDDHRAAGGADGADLQAIGDSLLSQRDALFDLYILVFTVGALMLYSLLYQSRLVPRWLSIWGLAAAAVMLVGTVLIMLDVFSESSNSLIEAVAVIPIPLNELALAGWLIVKGFDRRSPVIGEPVDDRTVPAAVG